MPMGPGPVFAYEWLTTSRRWQMYFVRSGFVAILLGVLAFVWVVEIQELSANTINAQVEIGRTVFYTIATTQLALILLAAPGATAGSICLDKARGTLTHLMVTDLSDGEIVLGKLGVRLIPTLGLEFCGLPFMALTTLLGGIDPQDLIGCFLVSIGVAVLGSTVAITFSVWATKTHEALMATYAVLIAWLISPLLWWMTGWTGPMFTKPPDWLLNTNPFYLVLADAPGRVDLTPKFVFLGGCLLVSAVLAAVGTLRLRVVTLNQANRGATSRKAKTRKGPVAVFAEVTGERPQRRRWFSFLPTPSLDSNPVLWREWHRALPSRWTRIIWWGYGLAATVLTAIAVFNCIAGNRMGAEVGCVLVNGGQVALGLLLMSIVAPTALAEERVRGSLDVLLTTPLSTSSIVWGKWWGSFRRVPLLVILPTVIALAAATSRNPAFGTPFGSTERVGEPWLPIVLLVLLVLAYGSALTSLGLAIATWVPRIGRAVGFTVGAYVLMTVGWVFLIAMTVNDEEGACIAGGSPFMGAAFTTITLLERQSGRDAWGYMIGWNTFWIVFYFSVAGALLIATLRTFERSLGRMPECGLSPKEHPEVAGVVKAEPELVLVGD